MGGACPTWQASVASPGLAGEGTASRRTTPSGSSRTCSATPSRAWGVAGASVALGAAATSMFPCSATWGAWGVCLAWAAGALAGSYHVDMLSHRSTAIRAQPACLPGDAGCVHACWCQLPACCLAILAVTAWHAEQRCGASGSDSWPKPACLTSPFAHILLHAPSGIMARDPHAWHLFRSPSIVQALLLLCRQQASQDVPLKVTLQELYSGTTKRRAVTRKVPSSSGGGVTEVKVQAQISGTCFIIGNKARLAPLSRESRSHAWFELWKPAEAC